MRDLIAKACAARGWRVAGPNVTVALPDGRAQTVSFEQFEHDGVAFLRLFSRLGDAKAVDERQLRASLRLNWTLTAGAIGITSFEDDGEKLVLTEVWPLGELDRARLPIVIEQLAATADRYEKHVFGTDTH